MLVKAVQWDGLHIEPVRDFLWLRIPFQLRPAFQASGHDLTIYGSYGSILVEPWSWLFAEPWHRFPFTVLSESDFGRIYELAGEKAYVIDVTYPDDEGRSPTVSRASLTPPESACDPGVGVGGQQT